MTDIEIKAGPELDMRVQASLNLSEAFAYYACSNCGRGKFDCYAISDGRFCSCERHPLGPIPRLELAPFRPSTDLNAAFSAAEKVGLWLEYGYCEAAGQHVISKTIPVASWLDTIAHAENPALAICAAILKLNGEPDD